MLTNFKTIQQSSEWSCGVTSALMVLEWYGKTGDWKEQALADLRHSLDGTTLRQAMDIFDNVGGFTYTTTQDYENPAEEVWLDTIQAWNDWGGHWQVIIGYDTMGTETNQGDVFLVAEPVE